MTVKELAEKYSFDIISIPDPERNIEGGYVGDLLSWVMGRAKTDNVWITIMTNVNIVAVAALADVSAVIIAEGACLDKAIIETAESKGINILSSQKTAYDIISAISKEI